MIRYHIKVYGLVQEVGFRFFVCHTALNYKLTGWVCNCYDDTVELEVQGDANTIDKFITALV